jgi:predicted nucleic acid-binding protein
LIVVDTNVLSELLRPAPDGRVVRWLRAHAHELAIPTIVIGELHFGVARLAPGRRKISLQSALDGLVGQFAAHVLSYDLQAAQACGEILAASEAAGRVMSLADAQIAAIARVARARLATRNEGDFAVTGLTLVNPWRS